MTSNLEKELSEILKKIHSIMKKKEISLQENHDLYFAAKDKYLVASEQEKSGKGGEYMLTIFFKVGEVSEKFVEEWQSDKFLPTDQELELLKKGCEEVLAAFNSHFKLNLLAYPYKPYEVHYAEAKEKIRKIRELIQKEEFSRRRCSS